MSYLEKLQKMPVEAKASVWFVICSILQRGISFITTPIFTRLMSTEQYGQVTLYNSWLEIFTVFATLDIFYGVYNNAMTKYPEDTNRVTSSMLGLCTSLTICIFAVYMLLRKPINSVTGMSTLLMQIMFVQILFAPAFYFWSAKQRYTYKYKLLVALSLLISILTPALGIPVVIISNDKGVAKIITTVASLLIVAVPLYIYLFRSGKKFFSKKYWRYALAFNLPLIPHYLSSTILNQSDRVMIANMCGKSDAGIYGLAYTLGMLGTLFSQAIMNSFTPYTYQHLKTKTYESISKNAQYLTFFIAIVSIGLVLVAPEIIWILGGDKYKPGIWVVAPVSASLFFTFLYSLYANIEFYYEENFFIMFASIGAALLNIILNYIFIRIYGFAAAGYTTLACYILYALFHYLFSSHVLRKHTGNMKHLYNDRMIFIVSVAVVLFSLLIMLFYKHAVIRYSIVLGIIIVLLLFKNKIVVIINGIRKKEKDF